MIRVGIWGCGGISAQHRRAYKKLEDAGVPVKLVALCDINTENFNREIKINISSDKDEPLVKIDNCYTDIDEMIEKENLDLIDVCLPTFLHKTAALKALENDINVLVEKPMANSAQECREMIEAAHKSKGQLMIGQSVRFSPVSDYLKQVADSGKYGKLVCADFARLSQTPIWRIQKGQKNLSRNDGVIFDMHIHDVDLVQYVFGMPEQISAVAGGEATYCDSVTTTFKYESGFVNIRGDWSLPQTFPFTDSWRVSFEHGAIACNAENVVTLYEDGKCRVVDEIGNSNSIYEEIKYFTDIIINGKENTKNPPESTLKTIELVEKIEESANSNGKIVR